MSGLITLRLLETFFRHRWLYLLPVLIMVAASGVYLATYQSDYTSKGVVYVNGQSLLATLSDVRDNSANYWVTPAQAAATEINDLLLTDAFDRAIVKQTKLEPRLAQGPKATQRVFEYVRKQVWASALGNNQVQVNATDADPQTAYQLASSLIDNYTQWKLNSRKVESQTAIDFFSSRMAEYQVGLDKARADLKAYISAHPEPIRGSRPYLETFEIDRLNGEIRLAEDRYNSALEREENARLSLQQVETDINQNFTIIDAPKVPASPDTSLRKILLSMGIFWVVGVLLSAALLVGNAFLDRTVRFPVDVTTQLNLPVIAVIPDFNPRKRSRKALKAAQKAAEQMKSAANTDLNRPETAKYLSGSD